MAIKINNVDVIDDTRKFIPVTIQAGGTVGTAGSILTSTGTGVEWRANAGVSEAEVFFISARR